MVEAVSEQASNTVAAVVSLGRLIFAASRVFYIIEDLRNVIWKVEAVPRGGIARFAMDRMRSLAPVLSVGFIMRVSLVLIGLVAAGSRRRL